MNGIALFIRSARSHLVPISFHVSHPVPSFFRSLRPQGSAYGTNGKEGGTGVSVENGGPERQTVSDGGRRDGKNTENPSRLSILLPWFCCLTSTLPTFPSTSDTVPTGLRSADRTWGGEGWGRVTSENVRRWRDRRVRER